VAIADILPILLASVLAWVGCLNLVAPNFIREELKARGCSAQFVWCGVALHRSDSTPPAGRKCTWHFGISLRFLTYSPPPSADGSLLLRELNHRIKNELTSTICAVSAKAVQANSVAVKAALLDVVDLLHQCADVHRALRMPDQGRFTDAARYLQQLCFSITKYRLDRLAIRVLFSADDLRLEGERCWKLALIVSELLTNVARHAQFDARDPELRVDLMLAGNVVKF
jgi:two-component sensor histidine kinase